MDILILPQPKKPKLKRRFLFRRTRPKRNPNTRLSLLQPAVTESRVSDTLPPPYRLTTHIVLGKATPQDLPPVSTKQLENITPYSAVPASTDGYQDTVVTAPTMTAVPQAAHSLSPATRLKHKLQHTTDLIVCPGVYDGLSARIAQAVGFETLYMV